MRQFLLSGILISEDETVVFFFNFVMEKDSTKIVMFEICYSVALTIFRNFFSNFEN